MCYCLNALTDEGMRAVSSLTVLTSLELWGCSKVTEEGMRAVSRARGATRRSRFEMSLLHHLQVRAEAIVRCAGLHRAQVAPVNKCRAMTVARMNLPCCVTCHPSHMACVRWVGHGTCRLDVRGVLVRRLG
jgi:hypothetical protein